MKKIILILTTLLIASNISYSQRISKYIDGIWGEWELEVFLEWKGSYDDFVLYLDRYDRHPSNYIMRVKIDNYPTEKKAKKRHLKDGWYEFTGVVEYFTTDYRSEYLNFNIDKFPGGCLTVNGDPYDGFYHVVDKKYVKVNRREATIKIAKQKTFCVNIFFDNIGIGYLPGFHSNHLVNW